MPPSERPEGRLPQTSRAGYHSPWHKKRFTRYAGLLGALFLFLQFILPVALAMGMMMAEVFRNIENIMAFPNPAGGAYWQGEYWYVSEPIFADALNAKGRLFQLPLRSSALPAPVGEKFPLRSAKAEHAPMSWLFPHQGRLYVISSSAVGAVQDGVLRMKKESAPRAALSRPFVWEERLAVIEFQGQGPQLLTLEQGDLTWSERGAMPWLGDALSHDASPVDVQIVSHAGVHQVFMRYGESLYHHAGMPEVGAGDQTLNWAPVTPLSGASWSAAVLNGRPAVLLHHFEKGRVEILQPKGERWAPVFSFTPAPPFGFSGHPMTFIPKQRLSALLPMERDGRFLLTFFDRSITLRVLECDESGVLSARIVAGMTDAYGPMAEVLIPLAAPLIIAQFFLAAILSWLMPRYKVSTIRTSGGAARLAPLLKRAIAQLIDFALLLIPLFAVFDAPWRLFTAPKEYMLEWYHTWLYDPFSTLPAMTFWIILLMLYGVVEGKTGATPGKWLLGLRTYRAADLAPCGALRGVIRNLLRLVDGLLYYLVGVMIAAFSKNWGRLGDMAAGTVVVDVRGKGDQQTRAGASSEEGFYLE